MEKQVYEKPQMEMEIFETEDIMETSNPHKDETDFDPANLMLP